MSRVDLHLLRLAHSFFSWLKLRCRQDAVGDVAEASSLAPVQPRQLGDVREQWFLVRGEFSDGD